MRHTLFILLVFPIIGIVLLLPSVFSFNPMNGHLTSQPTAVPTIFDYLPLVAKNRSPGSIPTPTVTSTAAPSTTPSFTPTPTTTSATAPTGSPTVTVTETPTPTVTVTGTPTPTNTPTTAGPSASPFGVDMSATGITEAGGISQIPEAGIEWVRVAMGWSFVEGQGALPPDSPVYNWNTYDTWVANATVAGVVPIMIVGYPIPELYRASGWEDANCGLLSDDGLDRFRDFLAAAAERYDGDGVDDAPGSPVVKYWELGNEPDSATTDGSHFGLCYGDYPDNYAELLRTAWSVLHNEPGREVYLVFGGTASEDCCGFNINFLDNVFDYIQNHPLSDGEEYFDVMNFHAYSSFVGRMTGGSYVYNPPSIITKANMVRDKLAAHSSPHLRDKPLMLTEAGRRDTSDQVAWGQPGTDERQSRYVPQLYVRSMAAGLQATTWFAAKDLDLGGTIFGYGLLDINNNPKQSYWAYKTLTEELDGYMYAAARTDSVSWPSPIEGHVFANGSGGEKWVVFIPPQNAGATQSMSFPFSKVKVVDYDKFNSLYPDGSGDPSKTRVLCGDGGVDVTITEDPIYVQPDPLDPCP